MFAAYCYPDDFVCSPGSCIERRLRCDGVTHCYNNADEINCNNSMHALLLYLIYSVGGGTEKLLHEYRSMELF